jgi:hypothetical protein
MDLVYEPIWFFKLVFSINLFKILSIIWIPKFFYTKPDGGKDSGVTGYFLIEWKPIFSIGILHFKEGTREAYHNHAFNALTWWLTILLKRKCYWS